MVQLLGAGHLPRYAKNLSREEYFRKMQSLCARSTFCRARNAAWLWLLWPTGCRVDELAKLKLSDLDWTTSTTRVLGKGAKLRQVRFTQPAQRAVYHYLKMRSENHCQLWISEERHPMRLTADVLPVRFSTSCLKDYHGAPV